MENHTFTEEEITKILKRAAQLESEQHQIKDERRPGLTLDELIATASDAGLDPENIRIAARALKEEPESESKTNTENNPDRVFAERWVQCKLSDEVVDAVIAELKHRYDASEAETSWFEEWSDESWDERFGKSSVQKTGKSTEWKHIDQYGALETRVLMQPRGKQVRVRVAKQNLWNSSGEGPGSEIFEYLAAIPFAAGLVVFFLVSYGFIANALIGFATYVGLEFITRPLIKKMKEKWGEKLSNKLSHRNKPNLKEDTERYKKEVEQMADNIAQILKTDLDESMIEDTSAIELPHMENILKNPDEESGQKKSRGKNYSS